MNTLAKKFATASATVAALPLFSTIVSAQSDLAGTAVDPGQGFATDLGSLINAVLSFVMVIAALLVFAYLILGGIEWITSGGDKGKTESARNKITAAVIGLIILAASYAILTVVLRFIGFDNLNDVLNNPRTIN
ncbi:MAG: pilin [bacterium]|nr:pilin [bacterium]